SITLGIVDVSGGNAGASTGGFGLGTPGGTAANFLIGNVTSGNPITDTVNVGFIFAKGGNGSTSPGEGGFGGDGGSGTIKAVTSVVLGPNAQVAQSQTVVDLSGGAGAAG